MIGAVCGRGIGAIGDAALERVNRFGHIRGRIVVIRVLFHWV